MSASTTVTTKTMWTPFQKQAIDARDCSILLSAAAGSGKTAVLVERILQRMKDPQDRLSVDQLVVTTFTDAAAGEMRERLALKIEHVLASETDILDEQTRSHLHTQLLLLPRANISTLHSFCKQILQRYFYLIDLDPSFQIAPEADVTLLRGEVLDHILTEAYEIHRDAARETSDFWQLISVWSDESGDSNVLVRMLALYLQARSHPRPHAWMDSLVRDYELGDPNRWMLSMREEALDVLNGLIMRMQLAIGWLEKPFAAEEWGSRLREDLANYSAMRAAWEKSWQDGIEQTTDITYSAAPRSVKIPETKASEWTKKIQQMRDQCKDDYRKFHKKIVRLNGGSADDLRKQAPWMRAIVALVKAFDEAFQTAKLERGWIDFADLEHLALKVLAQEQHGISTEAEWLPSAAALEVRAQLREVMVDEYQDTNRVQETILELITGSSIHGIRAEDQARGVVPRFMVGDVKQSIYRFRLAEPELFLAYELAYEHQAHGKKIMLSNNFRSQPNVLHAVNGLFQQLMRKGPAVIDYDQQAALMPSETDSRYESAREQLIPVELRVLLEQDADQVADATEGAAEHSVNEFSYGTSGDGAMGDGEEESFDSAAEKEAVWMANRIKQLIADGTLVTDAQTKQRRPVQFSDIAILLRSMGEESLKMVETMHKMGVPIQADVRSSWFDAPEVMTVLALLSILDNRKQDIPLAAVLRSAFFQWDENELTHVRIIDRTCSFADCFAQFAKQALQKTDQGQALSPIEQKASEDWQAILRWSAWRHHLNTKELLQRIWEERSFYLLQGALADGAVRQANLRLMLQLAEQFESAGDGHVYRFLVRINRMKEENVRVEASQADAGAENRVRVMTIHKSKGLEFPVVFVARLAKKWNLADNKEAFVLHRELGCGMMFDDRATHTRRPTMPLQAIRSRLLREQLAEELRVLYVALTRPKERLILVASPKKWEKIAEKWRVITEMDEMVISPDFWLQADNYFSWIGPALLRHPDASVLRESLGYSDQLPLDGAPALDRTIRADKDPGVQWLIEIGAHVGVSGVVSKVETCEAKVAGSNEVESNHSLDQRAQELAEALNWKYAYEPLTKLYAKVSIKHLREQQVLFEERSDSDNDWKIRSDENEFDADAQEQAQAVNAGIDWRAATRWEPIRKESGMARGAVVHSLMQRIDRTTDWSDSKAITKLEQWMNEQFEQLGVSAELANKIEPGLFLRFLNHPLGKRFCQAEEVWAEQVFTLSLSVNDVYPQLLEDAQFASKELTEQVLVQGIIDAFWQEENGLVLLDYKTDRTMINGLPGGHDRVRAYETQVEWYRRALQEATGMPVKAAYLFFMESGYVLGKEL